MEKRVLVLLGVYRIEDHRGIARAAKELGWHLHIGMLHGDEPPSNWKGDGIICQLDDNRKLCDFVLESNVPCVDLAAWRTDIRMPRISCDNEHIGEMAADHFVSSGHQNFAWFCCRPNPVSDARYHSFKNKLRTYGTRPPECFSGPETQDLQAVGRWLDMLPKPCAIFGFNDSDAAWLLNICTGNRFMVPDDFSILGVDNNLLICEYLSIPLSSINHNHERIGYEGARLLNRIMNGEPAPKDVQYIQTNGITFRSSTSSLAVQDPYVRNAILFMNGNLHTSISTAQIAAAVGISRRNLEARFRESLKSTVHAKLIELRVKKAEYLLLHSRMTIEDMVPHTGFCNAPHLCRSFKKAYGQPPTTYRKTYKEYLDTIGDDYDLG